MVFVYYDTQSKLLLLMCYLILPTYICSPSKDLPDFNQNRGLNPHETADRKLKFPNDNTRKNIHKIQQTTKPPQKDNDYENKAEARATEPPEREPNSDLVDENGFLMDDESIKLKDDSFDDDETNKTLSQSSKYKKVRGAKSDAEWPQRERAIIKKSNDTKSFCLLASDSGYWCDGNVGKLQLRFFYQKITQRCECIWYYGCDGNANNFRNINDCKQMCSVHGFVESSNLFNLNNCKFSP